MGDRIIKPITSEGRDRLVWAILDNTLRDWDKYAKCLWSKPMRVLAMYELKQIINFVLSDWYIYLTEGNSSQETIINGLINRITYEDVKGELLEYAKKKSRKPFLIHSDKTTSQISK